MQDKIKLELADLKKSVTNIENKIVKSTSKAEITALRDLLARNKQRIVFLESLQEEAPNAEKLLNTTKSVDTKWGTESLILAIQDPRTYVCPETFHLTNIGALRFNHISGAVYNIKSESYNIKDRERLILTVPQNKIKAIKRLIGKRYEQENISHIR